MKINEKKTAVFNQYNRPEREIYILADTHKGDQNEKWGVAKRDQVETKRFLITGTGRCGTDFMSKVMSTFGLDIPHERTGKDGTSSKWFFVDSDWYPMIPYQKAGVAHVGERLSDYRFDRVIHMVREPLSCIHSILETSHELDYEFLDDNHICPEPVTHENKIRRAMMLYYHINRYIPEHFSVLRVRLESLDTDWLKIVNFSGLPNEISKPDLPPSNHAQHYRRKVEQMGWSDLFDMDHILAGNIRKLAEFYGYKYG